MVECLSYGVKIMVSSQGKLCGNDIELPESADDDDVSSRTQIIDNVTLPWHFSRTRLAFVAGSSVVHCCVLFLRNIARDGDTAVVDVGVWFRCAGHSLKPQASI